METFDNSDVEFELFLKRNKQRKAFSEHNRGGLVHRFVRFMNVPSEKVAALKHAINRYEAEIDKILTK